MPHLALLLTCLLPLVAADGQTSASATAAHRLAGLQLPVVLRPMQGEQALAQGLLAFSADQLASPALRPLGFERLPVTVRSVSPSVAQFSARDTLKDGTVVDLQGNAVLTGKPRLRDCRITLSASDGGKVRSFRLTEPGGKP